MLRPKLDLPLPDFKSLVIRPSILAISSNRKLCPSFEARLVAQAYKISCEKEGTWITLTGGCEFCRILRVLVDQVNAHVSHPRGWFWRLSRTALFLLPGPDMHSFDTSQDGYLGFIFDPGLKALLQLGYLRDEAARPGEWWGGNGLRWMATEKFMELF